jgi:hypothetical protein
MSAKCKAVVEMDNEGNVIGRWPSARQCGIDCNIGHYLIAYYCKTMGVMKSGRIFRYEGDEVGEIEDIPDYPCITCRRFSRRGQQPFGYCMRLRRQVSVHGTCGEHEYPMTGRFIR